MHDLPTAVYHRIITVFDHMFRTPETNLTKLDTMLRNHIRPLQNNFCVRNQVIGCNKVQMKLDRGLESACSTCFNTRRPCMRLVRYEGAVYLALFPIHAEARFGTSWKDFGFWIQE